MSHPASLSATLVVAFHPSVATGDAQLAELTVHCLVPMLEALHARPRAKVAWHMGGHLLDHLARHHEGFLLRLKPLVQSGQLEVLGGPFYGGVPALLSEADLRGQVAMAAEFWESFLGDAPRGCLLPDLAFAAELPRLLNDTGIAYGVVSDAQVAPVSDAPPAWGRLERGGLGLYALCIDAELSARFHADAWQAFVEPMVAAARRHQPSSGPLAIVLPGESLGPVATSPQETILGRLLDAIDERGIETVVPGSLLFTHANAQPLVLVRDYAPLVASGATPLSLHTQPEELVAAQAVPSWAAVHIGSWAEFPARFAAVDTLHRRVLHASHRLKNAIEQMEDEGLEEAWSGKLATAQRAMFRAQSSEAFGAGRHGGFVKPAVRDAAQGAIAIAEETLDNLRRADGAQAYDAAASLRVSGTVATDGSRAIEELDEDLFVQGTGQTAWLSTQLGSVRSLEPKGARRNVLDAWTAKALLASSSSVKGGGLVDWLMGAEHGSQPLPWQVTDLEEASEMQPRPFRLSLEAQSTGAAGALSCHKSLALPSDASGVTLHIEVTSSAMSAESYAVQVPLRLGAQAASLVIDGTPVAHAEGQAEHVRRVQLDASAAQKATLTLEDSASGESPWSVTWQPGVAGKGQDEDGGVILTFSRRVGRGFTGRLQLVL